MKGILNRMLVIPAILIVVPLGILLILFAAVGFLMYSPYYIIMGNPIIPSLGEFNKKRVCCEAPEGFYLGTTCPSCNKSFRAVRGTGIEIEELPPPIGDFIMDNAEGKILPDGTYYHYATVCSLLKKYKGDE